MGAGQKTELTTLELVAVKGATSVLVDVGHFTQGKNVKLAKCVCCRLEPISSVN
jgi:hypothetical protein